MFDKTPSTEIFSASDARQAWSSLLNDVSAGEKRVIVEKNGTQIAAIISISDFRRFDRDDRRRRERFRILEEYSKAFEDVPDEELEREVDQAIQEVRAENRRAAQQRRELAQVLNQLRSAFRDLSADEIERELARVISEERDPSNQFVQRSTA